MRKIRINFSRSQDFQYFNIWIFHFNIYFFAQKPDATILFQHNCSCAVGGNVFVKNISIAPEAAFWAQNGFKCVKIGILTFFLLRKNLLQLIHVDTIVVALSAATFTLKIFQLCQWLHFWQKMVFDASKTVILTFI